MNAWDLTWFIVTLLGLIVTALLAYEAHKDRALAAPELQAAGRQVFRHECFRVIKLVMLLIAIGIMAWKNEIGDEKLIAIRSGLMAGVAVLLTVNSLMDLAFRLKHVKRRR
jgi:hypothetical protein